jgi:mannose-6-phosphate isomerase-like protein (cupin superfamily)
MNQFKPFKSFKQAKSPTSPNRIVARHTVPLSLLLGFCLIGCASSPRILLQDGTEFRQTDLAKVLAENLLGASENIKITNLGRGQDVSHHIVQVRDRESPHIHKMHDGTVVMMKGSGYLMMEDGRMDLSVGDVVFIPRGVVHYYVNSASEPTVTLVIFSPPFDGKDYLPVTAP